MPFPRLDRAPESPQDDGKETSSKTRWILLGTFGGMLLLMVLAGADSLRSLEQLNQISNESMRRFSLRDRALVTVVVSFHAYTDQMEQYLLSGEITTGSFGAAEITKRGTAVH